jgi:ATP-dependent helicase/nuclease subunit A
MTDEDDGSMTRPNSQASASDPGSFVWVAANAGSGKTHVLVQRLMRILLAGTPPARILCLTFTNAAAAEMANRLFMRLSDWAVARDDHELGRWIEELTGMAPDAATLARARRLFPIALDSPGGLRIHTIHAFCERLLHRFPLEAGVSPHFEVIDERGQGDLLGEAREQVMARAAAMEPDAPLVGALATVSALAHDMSLDSLVARMVAGRSDIAALYLDDPERSDAVFTWLATLLEIDPNDREAELIARDFAAGVIDTDMCVRAAGVLAGGSTTDRGGAERLAALARAKTPEDRYEAHCALTLTADRRKLRASLMTRSLSEAHPDIAEWLDRELERGARLLRRVAGIATFEATKALLVLADAIIGAYERAKTDGGLLDYDDLIARARSLLLGSQDAAWVLYKLDGGIDHILVDEAQDTSPSQWQIVSLLAEDMLSGETARAGGGRATFAVGDEKQSIFSFQGADPAMFTLMRRFFEERARGAGHTWALVPLETSYRSAPAILAAVDRVFADAKLARALSADGEPPHHDANRNVPGRVEIWPTAGPDGREEPDPWTAPVDYVGPGSPQVKLAITIADEISGWLSSRTELEAEGRPVRPSDIMILVRRRNTFVDAMVRELKARDVPVAGIDRMRLTDQIAVEDLIALARFVLLPEDDLSLAALMKSPLLGLGEDDLFALAHGRSASLWRSLCVNAARNAAWRDARDRAAHWLSLADQMPPFAFFSRILSEDRMRQRIMARLGVDCADPIEEFLNAALDYERTHPPSLEGFIAWLARSEGEIKRDMDHGRDEVRVMTIHGAKGLEANIVILPDTCQTPREGRGVRLYDIEVPGTGYLPPPRLSLWPRRGAEGFIDAVSKARAEADRRANDEYLRLLYVAMTRARDWLIITGYEAPKKKRPDGCWYNLVTAGLDGALDGFETRDGATRWRFRHDTAPGAASDGEPTGPGGAILPVKPPAWALGPVARPAGGTRRLAPSRSGQAMVPGDVISPLGEGSSRRFSRGLAVHALLELLLGLPEAEWPALAERHLARIAPDLSEDMRAELAAETLSVLRSPGFAPFLTPEARSEAAFAATVAVADGAPVLVNGRIDRLAIVDGVVHVVDFKTHRPAPRDLESIPAAHVEQMALYRAALAQIFTGSEIAAALLWTDTAELMALPGELLDQALHTALKRNRVAAT